MQDGKACKHLREGQEPKYTVGSPDPRSITAYWYCSLKGEGESAMIGPDRKPCRSPQREGGCNSARKCFEE
jgi:hypothetical protein